MFFYTLFSQLGDYFVAKSLFFCFFAGVIFNVPSKIVGFLALYLLFFIY